MTAFVTRPRARILRFDEDTMRVGLADRGIPAVPMAYFPRLLRATPEQRLAFEMSGGGTGLHRDQVDEDIRVEGLLLGGVDRTGRGRQEAA